MATDLIKLPLGSVRPAGWLRRQMQKDLDGFVGHLDQLAPALMIDDKIYGEHRLTAKVTAKNVGNIQPPDKWVVQYLWWNSESQSNWWDGYLRHAFLLRNEKHLSRVENFVQYILSTQDSDGYIGIYAPDLRYQCKGENGELWSKATLYRVLLAYYSATGRQEILNVIVNAVEDVMRHFPVNSSEPFEAENAYAGVSHGLMFTDILEELYMITRDRKYLDYAVFLFSDYSKHEVSEKDVQLGNILNYGYKFTGHGVHTYEHLRALANASFASDDPSLGKALKIYLQRVAAAVTVSGGPIGDEWIFERDAHASDTGYEYCSIQELMHSYLFLLRKTGDPVFAEHVERIFLNAAQGARHPDQSSIAYLKTDNSFEMSGTRNGIVEEGKNQTRYKYSPVHQDVAVCCSPNAGRIAPYYVEHMWMMDDEGLVAFLFGPGEAEFIFKDQRIAIKEVTAFPNDFTINFEISVAAPLRFVLKIRKPRWSRMVMSNGPISESNGFLIIDREWKGTDRVQIEFTPALEIQMAPGDEIFFSYGPLVLAHAIDATEIKTKEYGLNGFCDVHYKPEHLVEYEYDKGWVQKDEGELAFHAELRNKTTGNADVVRLVPMGRTILRQVTFKRK